MTPSANRTGFSLLEVILAAGILAVTVTAALALLPAMVRQTADSADALAAQRLPDSLRVELQRLANGGLDALAAAVPAMTTPLDHGLDFVATRDGARLHSRVHRPPVSEAQIPAGDQFFHIEVWRFNQAPLGYIPGASVLPLYVRISWPYRNPGNATPTNLSNRSQLTFTVALNR